MAISHLAIIMDGNRRWAATRNLKTIEGHRAGVDALTEITKFCAEEGIKYLTVYALSTENLKERSKVEIAGLLRLIHDGLRDKLAELNKNGVRVEFLGNLDFLPQPLKIAIGKFYKILAGNKKLQLNICLNYGSRAEIAAAAQKLVAENVANIDERVFQSYLYTKDLPDPDLIIRTGGQHRLSNFLLWQAAYSELFFTETLWPDFDRNELNTILQEFEERKRNFGR